MTGSIVQRILDECAALPPSQPVDLFPPDHPDYTTPGDPT